MNNTGAMRIHVLNAPKSARFNLETQYQVFSNDGSYERGFTFDENCQSFFLAELDWKEVPNAS